LDGGDFQRKSDAYLEATPNRFIARMSKIDLDGAHVVRSKKAVYCGRLMRTSWLDGGARFASAVRR
jgi:hypothetical protein